MQNGTNSKKRKTLAKNQLFIARESLYFLTKMFFACCKFGTVIAIQCVRIDWIECSQIEGRRYNGPNNQIVLCGSQKAYISIQEDYFIHTPNRNNENGASMLYVFYEHESISFSMAFFTLFARPFG